MSSRSKSCNVVVAALSAESVVDIGCAIPFHLSKSLGVEALLLSVKTDKGKRASPSGAAAPSAN